MNKKKAPRNKTIVLSLREEVSYAKKAIKLSPQKHDVDFNNCIIWQDTFNALRYIPDIQRDYREISQSAQARGVELGKEAKLRKRLKNSAAILFPLVLSSIERIETIANAMELRGFGKYKKRTWIMRKKMEKRDYAAIAFGVVILGISLYMIFHNEGRFYNPF